MERKGRRERREKVVGKRSRGHTSSKVGYNSKFAFETEKEGKGRKRKNERKGTEERKVVHTRAKEDVAHTTHAMLREAAFGKNKKEQERTRKARKGSERKGRERRG